MIELYKLIEGNSTRATITSAVESVVFGGETYIPKVVKRSQIISRPDLLQNRVTLQMSVHDMLGLNLLAEVNNNLAHRLIIYRGETTFEQIWAGSLTQQSCSGEVAQLVYGGGGIALRQLGDRRPFQRRCPFILYDPLTCQATPQIASARVTAINATKDVLLVSGLSSADVGYYTGGVCCPSAVYDRSNAGNSFISSHNKTANYDQIRLSTPIDVSVGDSLSVLAGCDRTWQTCYSKFNNIINFGGFPYLPLENPYIAEVCSDDGATFPILSLSGNYAILIALDISGSMRQQDNRVARIATAVEQSKFLLRNIQNGLIAGGGSGLVNVIGFTGADLGQGGRGAISTFDNSRVKSLPFADTTTTITPDYITRLESLMDEWADPTARTYPIPSGGIRTIPYGNLVIIEPDGVPYVGNPADKIFAYSERWFGVNNASDRRNILLIITDGDLSTEPFSFASALQSPIVTKTAPFAPPLDVKTYGINIALADTSQTQQLVNTNTPVPVVTTADPDLYYRILFIEDRATQ